MFPLVWQYVNDTVLQLVPLLAFWAGRKALVIKPKAMPKLAHVAHMAGWVAEPKLISADVFGDNGPRTDKGKSPNVMPTDDGGIGADGGPLADMGMEVLITTGDGRARVEHIGEDHAGAQENIIVAGDATVD